jgi:hypothetical protein
MEERKWRRLRWRPERSGSALLPQVLLFKMTLALLPPLTDAVTMKELRKIGKGGE